MNTHLTAMARTEASVPAAHAYDNIMIPNEHKSVLDWGCGKGKDVLFFKELGLRVVGYDPYFIKQKPKHKYDCVMVTYILNVLGSEFDRRQCLSGARRHLKKGGRMVISVRSVYEINKEAQKNTWLKKDDGWITKKNTFQHGFELMELVELAKKASLIPITCAALNSSCVVLVASR